MIDHSTPEAQAIFEREVRKRMDPPFSMSRAQAEMLVAVLMWGATGHDVKPTQRADR